MYKLKSLAISFKKNKIKSKVSLYIQIALILAGMILFIVKPDVYIKSFSNGLLLFCKSVLPSLFPFIFFTKLLTSKGVASRIGKILGKPFKKLYKTNEASGYVFTMSILSGYPIGASITSDLFSANIIDKEDALAISSFCSTSGPLFILGTINGFFDNYKFALLLLITNYLSALINGLVYRKKTVSKGQITITNNETTLSNIIQTSINSILVVGGFIALFNMFADMLLNLGIVGFFGSLINKVFVNLPTDIGTSFLVGIIEMTRGCLMLSAYEVNSINAALCSFILSFGGIGIAMQSITFLQRCNISAFDYFLRKFSQATIALVLSIPLCFLFGV